MSEPKVTQSVAAKVAAVNGAHDVTERYRAELQLSSAFEMYRNAQTSEERAAVLRIARRITQPMLDLAYGPISDNEVRPIIEWRRG